MTIEWTDVDTKRKIVKCTLEKYGKPRMFNVSHKLIGMIKQLPKHNQLVFGGTTKTAHRLNFLHKR